MFVVSDFVIRAAELNNYAGRQLEVVVFYFLPGAALVGGVIGLVAALRHSTAGPAELVKTLAITISITAGLVSVWGGVWFLRADKPPKLDGKPLMLEFEVRVPASVRLPEPLTGRYFYPSFFETMDAHWVAKMDFERVVRNGTGVIVRGRGRIRSSRSTQRSIEIALLGEETSRWQKIYLPLRGSPQVRDSWSDWIPAQTNSRGDAIPESEKMSLRYRVQISDGTDVWE